MGLATHERPPDFSGGWACTSGGGWQWKEYMDRYRKELRADHDKCWAEEELAAAVAAGITDGKHPHDLVTREEAAIMALRSGNQLGGVD